jgi:hypothetical protein
MTATNVDGVLHIPAFDLPFSSFASREGRDAYFGLLAMFAKGRDSAADNESILPADIHALRKQIDDEFVLPLVAKQHARWHAGPDSSTSNRTRSTAFTPRHLRRRSSGRRIRRAC